MTKNQLFLLKHRLKFKKYRKFSVVFNPRLLYRLEFNIIKKILKKKRENFNKNHSAFKITALNAPITKITYGYSLWRFCSIYIIKNIFFRMIRKLFWRSRYMRRRYSVNKKILKKIRIFLIRFRLNQIIKKKKLSKRAGIRLRYFVTSKFYDKFGLMLYPQFFRNNFSPQKKIFLLKDNKKNYLKKKKI